MMMQYPAHIHRGTRAEAVDGNGPVIALLADLKYHADLQASDQAISHILLSVTTIGHRLVDLTSAPHAFSIGHGVENGRNWVACGNIGGYVANDLETNPNGDTINAFVGLEEVSGSGYTGTAWLQATADGQTIVTLFLGRDLSDGTKVQATTVVDTPSPTIENVAGNYASPATALTHGRANSFAQSLWGIFKAVASIVGAIIGLIVSSEISIFIAWSAWNLFGPLSLIFTSQFWALYPVWWLWRRLIEFAV